MYTAEETKIDENGDQTLHEPFHLCINASGDPLHGSKCLPRSRRHTRPPEQYRTSSLRWHWLASARGDAGSRGQKEMRQTAVGSGKVTGKAGVRLATDEAVNIPEEVTLSL